jgi:hypothetical protein
VLFPPVLYSIAGHDFVSVGSKGGLYCPVDWVQPCGIARLVSGLELVASRQVVLLQMGCSTLLALMDLTISFQMLSLRKSASAISAFIHLSRFSHSFVIFSSLLSCFPYQLMVVEQLRVAHDGLLTQSSTFVDRCDDQWTSIHNSLQSMLIKT